jgi:hypothetical protein
MKKQKWKIATVVAALGSALSAQANLTPIGGPSSDGNPPGTLVDVMHALVGPGYDATSAANRVDDSSDQIWTSGGKTTSTLLLEIAGNRNDTSFGLYNLSTLDKLEVFSGPQSAVTAQTVIFTGTSAQVGNGPSVDIGNNFGFYISGPGGTFYSQQGQNGGTDHMLTLTTATATTLQLDNPALGSSWAQPNTTATWNPNEYLLAWEDLPNGDFDYQDMLVKVDATPVPEPTTMLAGALLLLPFGASTLRILRKELAA